MSTVLGKTISSQTIVLPETGVSLKLDWAALSHLGLVRKVNEDSLLANLPVFSVCDGMGGHASGDVASQIVVTELAELMGQQSTNPKEIYHALVRAEEKVDALTGEAELAGAGTTVTGIALSLEAEVPHWYIFNIGDSRVYRFFDDELKQVTIDHSLVQEMVDNGFLSADEAEDHPDNNVITRAIGFHGDPLPDGWKTPVQQGERYLLCSDGLSKELSLTEIEMILREESSAESAALRLQDSALAKNGRDNITVIVLDTLELEIGVVQSADQA
ncbi:MAG: protein phosphatase 2C domain-containing protein [Microbacteriaceae bacterium]